MDERIRTLTPGPTARPPRVLVISEIPTPYRLPLYARLAALPELSIDFVFCALGEPDRPWEIDAALAAIPHRVLPGFAPTLRSKRNTFVYQLNPRAVPLMVRSDYDVVVVGGYAVFAAQAAIAIARVRGIPYLLHSESTLTKPRPGWVQLVKRGVVGSIVSNAAGALAAGSGAVRYLVEYGMDPGRIRIMPNTIDVRAYRAAAAAARARAAEIRAQWSLPEHFVLYAGRLIEIKGVSDLLAAVRLLGRAGPEVVVAGVGPLEDEVQATPGVRHLGFVQQAQLIELLALADWAVVPSQLETWGVIVNEALACGCPVIVTDAVGSGEDLVRDGVNGAIVPVGDHSALAAALAMRPPTGTEGGPIERWDYDLGVDQFVDAVRLALPGRVPQS
jgi:glycosyltransferase involved in cell wall biosynthesis